MDEPRAFPGEPCGSASASNWASKAVVRQVCNTSTSAIDAALLAEEWDAADAHADALAERTAAEPLLHHLCPRVKRPDAHPLRCLRRAVAVVHHRNARPASDGGNLRASGGADFPQQPRHAIVNWDTEVQGSPHGTYDRRRSDR